MSNYILNGKIPVKEPDMLKWAEQWKTPSLRRVAEDNIGYVRIITTFLGIDHNFLHLGDDDPILFETMVFGGRLDGKMKRYRTWEEAENGHKEMVLKIKELSDNG